VIDAVCSDHQPHEMDAKLAPFSESASGISGLETLFSLMLKLVDETTLSLSDAIARVTTNPAQILGIDVGKLLPGAPADICIVDTQVRRKLGITELISRGKNSPFTDTVLQGSVKTTIVAGNLVSSSTCSRG